MNHRHQHFAWARRKDPKRFEYLDLIMVALIVTLWCVMAAEVIYAAIAS